MDNVPVWIAVLMPSTSVSTGELIFLFVWTPFNFRRRNGICHQTLVGMEGRTPMLFLFPFPVRSDPWTQEHTVTELLNLSLHEDNKKLIFNAGAVKSLIVWASEPSVGGRKQDLDRRFWCDSPTGFPSFERFKQGEEGRVDDAV